MNVIYIIFIYVMWFITFKVLSGKYNWLNTIYSIIPAFLTVCLVSWLFGY